MKHEAFYSTTAVVLPVLFLALTLQNSVVLKAIEQSYVKGKDPLSQEDPWTQALTGAFVALIALLLGVVAEALTVVALATNHDSDSFRWFIGIVTILLSFGLVVGFLIGTRQEVAIQHRLHTAKQRKADGEVVDS
jgi:hypothetical protein